MCIKFFGKYVVLGMLLLSGCALTGASAPTKTSSGMLTDQAGMTLYTFDKDTTNKSACYGQCAANWPPLIAASDAKGVGNYSIIERDDGKRQWTYKGQPLYTWIKDQMPGDQTGNGVNNVWHTAKP